MSKIQKNLDEEKSIMNLVVGTENCDIVILESSGLGVKNTISLKSVPTFLDCVG